MPETEKNVAAFSKMVGRGDADEGKDDFDDIDGDVLILDPEKPKPKLPTIDFNKQMGRPDPREDEFKAENEAE